MKAIKHLSVIVGVLIGLLITVELGLYVRHFANAPLPVSMAKSGKTRVLLIGDSVLGTGADTDAGITSALLAELQIRHPDSFEVVNHSVPANTSMRVAQIMDRELASQRPHLVVLMLGRSDNATRDRRDVEHSYLSYFAEQLSHLRIARLYWQVEDQILTARVRALATLAYLFPAKALHQLADQKKTEVPDPFELGWAALAKQDCPSLISYFEEGLRLTQGYRRALFYLHYCYLETRQSERGARYLETLGPRSSINQALIRMYALDLRDRNSKNLVGETSQSDERLRDTPASADRYFGALWLQRRLGHAAKVNGLFEKGPGYSSLFEDQLDVSSYRKIIQTAVRANVPVLAVQYPSDPDGTVLRAIHPFDRGVYFLSLRASFLRAIPQHDIGDDFDDDFLHLTETGRGIAARSIAQTIDQILSK